MAKATQSRATEAWPLLKMFAGVYLLGTLIQSTAYAGYYIPSSSMEPTLEIGDRILVSRSAYGYSRYSLPFDLPLFEGRIFGSMPKTGDVVVFRHPDGSGDTVIKRVIGLPGDRIAFRHGRLVINGKMVPREYDEQIAYRSSSGRQLSVTSYFEQFSDGSDHLIFERSDQHPLDNFGEILVPEGTVFVAGDNRDNSKDSRARGGPGFLPVENLIGRAEFRTYSLYDCADGKLDHKSEGCHLGLAWHRFLTRID